MFFRALLVLSALLLLPWHANAQTADVARAEKLFAEASALAEKGEYAAACPKFEESQMLDPAVGTQFNLALCQEKLGRFASAWRNFREVERIAHATGKKAREEGAREKLSALRPLVGHLVLAPADADVTVKVDGARVEKEEWTFYPVSPGEHTVEASASARKPYQTKAIVPPTPGAEVRVEMPALVAARETRVVTVETSNTRRVAGLVIGGVGIAGVVGAVVTGLLVLDAKATADAHCAPSCVDDAGRNAVSTGKTLIVLNAVAWGVAAVGLGLGATLVITAPKRRPVATISSYLTPVGVGLIGHF